MASFVLTLGTLLLCWNGLSLIAKIMMIGALIVMFFGYGNVGAHFGTRSRGSYLPAKPIR